MIARRLEERTVRGTASVCLLQGSTRQLPLPYSLTIVVIVTVDV